MKPSTPEQHREFPGQRSEQRTDVPAEHDQRDGHEQPLSVATASPRQDSQTEMPPQQQPYVMPPYSRQPYQGQPPIVMQNFYQAPPMYMQAPMMVNVESAGPNILLRALWFVFIGWWLGLLWLHIGYALCLTGIFLPVGLVMLNRLPTVLTLRSSSHYTTVRTYQNGMISVRVGEPQQVDFLLRAVYFLLVGWWLGYLWALVGYLFCFTIVLMPIGLLMLNRLPTVLTLRRL